MYHKFLNWIDAIRLRTLLLSVSCIGMGLITAYAHFGSINTLSAVLTVFTALFLQILSNLANDFGDSIHGADSDLRKGPARTVQTGKISKEAMKKAMILTAVLAFASGILLLYLSYDIIGIKGVLILLTLGLFGIAAAILYTNGKKPYGYEGLGDVSVFLFFGLLAVYGTFYLQTGFHDPQVLLPACAMGFLATGVLNINNMRDIETDKIAGKKSIPVRFGLQLAKIYQYLIVVTALILMQIYGSIMHIPYWFMLPYPLFLAQLIKIKRIVEPYKLDPLLRELAIATFLLVLLFAISVVYA